MKHKIISFPELRLIYLRETGKQWIDSNSKIQDEYVTWLENKLLNMGVFINYDIDEFKNNIK